MSRLLTCKPIPMLCQMLSASVEFWRILDAMGIKDEDLSRSGQSSDQDARPQSFADAEGIRVERGDKYYIVFVRHVLSEQCIKRDENTTKTFCIGSGADPEQSAGDGVIAASRLASGPCLNALRRWLQLYGWRPGNELQLPAPPPPPPA